MTTTTKSELTEAQHAELVKLEKQIKQGQEAFFATCRALVEIEARKLYVPYDTLADYAAQRWDYSPSDVSRFKAAARVLEILEGFDKGKMPRNEAQARHLAKLKEEPEALKEVWRRVLANGKKITGALVSTEVKRYLHENRQNSGATTGAGEIEEGTGTLRMPAVARSSQQDHGDTDTSEQANAGHEDAGERRQDPAQSVSKIITVVHWLTAIDDELNGDDLDDQSRMTLEEQLKLIDELAAKIRSRLSLAVVAA